MNLSRVFPLLSLAALAAGCGGATEGASPSPAESVTLASATRPSCVSSTPTLFVPGAPASIATSVSTSTAPNVTWNAADAFVQDVVTDGATLYWTLCGKSDGTIISAPIASGSPKLLIDERGEGSPSHLSVQGARLFWLETSATNPSLARAMTSNLDGSSFHALTSFAPIADVAFDASAAYVAEGTLASGVGASLARIDATSGAATTLVEGTPVANLAVDDASVYFLNVSVVARVPKSGGTVTTIAPMPSLALGGGTSPAGAVASDGSFVYWAIAGDAPQVLSMPVGGGGALELGATGQAIATFLQPHGAWLYFTSAGDPENTSAIYRLATNGGSPSVVVPLDTASTIKFANYGGTTSSGRIALDTKNVYWGAFDGTLTPSIFCIAQ